MAIEMANEPVISVTGFLGTDAEYRKTPTGIPVTNFSLANTPRKHKDGEWADGETTWFRVFVWNHEAAGTANVLRKGDKVTVTGRFQVNTFTDKEGTERKSLEINADVVGVVPKYAPEPATLAEIKHGEDLVSTEDFPW